MDSPYIDFGEERIKGTLYPFLLWFKPLYNVHLTITATFVCPKVAVVELQLDCIWIWGRFVANNRANDLCERKDN